MAKNKAVLQKNISYGEKQVKDSKNNPDSYLHLRPSWRFERSFGQRKWDLYSADFEKIASHKVNLERMKWSEIIKQTHDSGKSSNHYITADKLCKEAQNMLSELQLEEYGDMIFSLRLNNKCRLFGLLQEGVYTILWLVENHEICPSYKKHT